MRSLNKTKTASIAKGIWKVENITGNEFITIVLDRPLLELNANDRNILANLKAVLNRCGIYSYVITSAIDKVPVTTLEIKEFKKLGLTRYFVKKDNGWFDDIIKPAREKGLKCDVIVATGPAFYQIIKTATDVTVEDMIFPYLDNYVYVGHDYCGPYDAFVYPLYSVNDMFFPGKTAEIELGCWKMNFMVSIFKKIHDRTYHLPRNMEKPILKEIGEDEVDEFLKSHFNEPEIAFDLETSGFDFIDDKIRCITMAFDETTGYYMEWDLFRNNPERLKLLSDMLESCKSRITQNGKFDIKFLWENGISHNVTITEDSMTAAHVLCSDRLKGLKTQAYYYTPFGGYDLALDRYRERTGNDDYSIIPKPILMPYATMDSVMTMRIYHAVIDELKYFNERFPSERPPEQTGGKVWSPYEWYHDYLMRLYPVICEAEYQGLYIDEEVLNDHRQILMDKAAENKKKFCEIYNLPEDVDLNSVENLGDLLQSLGWPCHGISDKGKYTTDDDAFTEWKRDKMPGVKELKNYRSFSSGYRTYLGIEETVVDQKKGTIKKEKTGWLPYLHKHPDGTLRIHANFGVGANNTFRCRCSNPNLQNIPTRSEAGNYIKQTLTVPPADMYYLVGDSGKEYKAAEVDYVHVKLPNKYNQAWIEARFLEEDMTLDESGEVVVDFETGSKYIEETA